MKKIVIVGGGFAGISAAIQLSEQLKGRAETILVDLNNYHLFKPMLQEVATGSVEPGHIIQPIRHIMKARRFIFVQGMVQQIDTDTRSVLLCENCQICPQESECPFEDFDISSEDMKCYKRIVLHYDYLILALGGSPN